MTFTNEKEVITPPSQNPYQTLINPYHMNLRPYQQEAISDLRESFKNGHRRIILALPTGAGKTVVFSEMVRMAADKGTRVLVLTDRIELFEQTFKAIQRHNIPIQIVNANTASIDQRATVTVAMIETLHRRAYNVEPDLIIIDEAHKGNFTKLIDAHPTSRVIGATATPVGKHIPKYYSDIIQTIDTPDLVNRGYLCECKAFQMVDDFSDLTIKGKEYTDESLFNHFNKRKLYSGVVTEWQKRTPDKKTIIFNVNIEHSNAMANEFNENGIVSESITSKTPKAERERILAAFSKGLFPVLNNCGILTTGYDEPSIECVIMNRKTLSLPLFLQCLGRGSRIYPGKSNFTVLDFGMNHDQHGMWNEPREWSLKEKKKKKEGAAPVKTCPKCEAMLYATAKVCKFCNHVFEQVAAPAVEGVMVEVVPKKFIGKTITELSLVELVELQKTKKYKASFIWRVIRSKGEETLKEYAGLMGYTSGWVYRQSQLLSDSKFNDYAIRN